MYLQSDHLCLLPASCVTVHSLPSPLLRSPETCWTPRARSLLCSCFTQREHGPPLHPRPLSHTPASPTLSLTSSLAAPRVLPIPQPGFLASLCTAVLSPGMLAPLRALHLLPRFFQVSAPTPLLGNASPGPPLLDASLPHPQPPHPCFVVLLSMCSTCCIVRSSCLLSISL